MINEVQRHVELFEIRNASEITRFNDSTEDIVYNGMTYVPANIQRTEFSVGTDMAQVTCSVTCPMIPQLTQYLASYPIRNTEVRIYKWVENTPPDLPRVVLIFNGKVKSVAIKDHAATAECFFGDPVYTTEFPKLVYASACQHTLYDSGCGLLRENFKETVNALLVPGGLQSPIFASHPNGYYTYGYVYHAQEFRMILGHTGDTILLHIPFGAEVASGTAVDVYPGCDLTFDMCKNKFNNVQTGQPNGFLGMPTIPSVNPVIWGLTKREGRVYVPPATSTGPLIDPTTGQPVGAPVVWS